MTVQIDWAGTPSPPVAWSPDSKSLFVFTKTKALSVDPGTGAKTAQTAGPRGELREAAFSKDGNWVAAIRAKRHEHAETCALLLFHPDRPNDARAVFTTKSKEVLGGLSWSTDGKRLAVRWLDDLEEPGRGRILIFAADGKSLGIVEVPPASGGGRE